MNKIWYHYLCKTEEERGIFIPYIYIHKYFKYLQMISMIQIDIAIDTLVVHTHTHTTYIKLEATFLFRDRNWRVEAQGGKNIFLLCAF